MFYSKPYNLLQLSTCVRNKPYKKPLLTNSVKSEIGSLRYRSFSAD